MSRLEKSNLKIREGDVLKNNNVAIYPANVDSWSNEKFDKMFIALQNTGEDDYDVIGLTLDDARFVVKTLQEIIYYAEDRIE